MLLDEVAGHLSPHQKFVLRELMDTGYITRERFETQLYTGPDGGPLDMRNTFCVMVFDTRKALRPGWSIELYRSQDSASGVGGMFKLVHKGN